MTMMTRRAFGFGALAGSVALGSGAASLAPAFAADKIKVGILPLTSHSPDIIAQGRGYFAKHGIDASFVTFQAAQPMAVAIASGDVDFGITAITAGLISLADKGAVKVIGGALEEASGVEGEKIIVSKKAHDEGVTTPAKLKGRIFGITTTGSSFHYMAHKIAQKEGFPESEIQLKPLQKVPTIIAALKSGQIDAWSIVPNIADALTKGGSVVQIGKIADYIPHYQVTTVFTSSANVEKKSDLVKRFLAAYSMGVADYNTALVEKKMSKDELDAIVKMIHQHVYANMPLDKASPRILAAAMRISPNAELNLESVKDQFEWFKAQKMVPAGVTMAKLVDTRFVKTK